MLEIQNYGDSEDENQEQNEDKQKSSDDNALLHFTPIPEANKEFSVMNQIQVCSAPEVFPTVSKIKIIHLHASLNHNLAGQRRICNSY